MRALAAAAALAFVACRAPPPEAQPFRLGYFPNLTHAQALVGVADGTFAHALGVPLQVRRFNAGPAAMEALLSGDLDAAYVGPGPASIAFLRTHGEALRVIAGAVSGGVVLVVRPEIATPRDLLGRRVASPQRGNTQDVSLRTWLRAQGLAEREGADGVAVTPVASPDMAGLLARGDLAGAWVPEPWGSLLRQRVQGRVLVDERSLWPGGRFPATVLAVSTRALRERRRQVASLLSAHLALTRRWAQAPHAFGRAANDALGALTGKPLSGAALDEALTRMEPTSDPMEPALTEMARRAQSLGYAPPGDVSSMVDGSLLQELARR